MPAPPVNPEIFQAFLHGSIMWIVKLVTFFEYHPYLFFCLTAMIVGLIWLAWREIARPSYKQQREVEELLRGFEQAKSRLSDPEGRQDASPPS